MVDVGKGQGDRLDPRTLKIGTDDEDQTVAVLQQYQHGKVAWWKKSIRLRLGKGRHLTLHTLLAARITRGLASAARHDHLPCI